MEMLYAVFVESCSIITAPKATLTNQVVAFLLFAPVIHFLYYVIRKYGVTLLNRQPWVEHVVDREIERMHNIFDLQLTREEAKDSYVHFIAMILQHMFGAMLCIPFLFFPSSFDRESALMLARNGALVECSWEFCDIIERLYVRAFHKDGSRKQPNSMLVKIACHHFCGFGMVIPMNLFYGEEYFYLRLVFVLQGVAAVGLIFSLYMQTFDMDIPAELTTMKILSYMYCIVLTYSRTIEYYYSALHMLYIFYAAQDYKFLVAGSFAFCSMQVLNYSFIRGSFQKIAKLHNHKIKSMSKRNKSSTSVYPMESTNEESELITVNLRNRNAILAATAAVTA